MEYKGISCGAVLKGNEPKYSKKFKMMICLNSMGIKKLAWFLRKLAA
jgi:hypothetical protein